MPKSALFVCLGNICRSPIAEAQFRTLIENEGLSGEWKIDSAALGPWHVGNGPHKSAVKVLKDNGIDTKHKARELKPADFTKFDFIFGMDDENMDDINSMKPANSTARIEKLGTYDPEGVEDVADPYYGNEGFKDFQVCFAHCDRCVKEFFNKNAK